jgi:alpha-beta hydrolase superfamily lysophospholipase
VYAFDFRGHGGSDGETTLGDLEALDVCAVVRHARRECGPRAFVVTIGASMGGIAVLREAATSGCGDAVVSISAPAQWLDQGRRAKVLGKLVTSRWGRALARRYLFTRVAPAWTDALPPVELVRTISKPMLFVHGADDHFVNSDQATALARASDGRARLRLIAHYGHAEAGFADDHVVDVIDHEIDALVLARRPSGD